MSDQDSIVEVYCAKNEAEARLIETMLKEAGVECRVVGQFLTGAVGEIPPGMASSPGIWVPANRLEAAREVLDNWEAARGPFRVPSWTCPRCDTEIESGFDTCWNCLYCPAAC